MNLHVAAMCRIARASLPAVIEAGCGNIIHVSSIIVAPDRNTCGAAKAAVIGMAKSIAAEFVSKGVHCSAIRPGTIDTPSLEGRICALVERTRKRANIMSRQPVGRLRRPVEVVARELYLASDEGAFVTGQAIPIDGGWSNV